MGVISLTATNQNSRFNQFAIFQSSEPPGPGAPMAPRTTLVWRVIHAAPGSRHHLVYDPTPSVICTAPDGKTTPPVPVKATNSTP